MYRKFLRVLAVAALCVAGMTALGTSVASAAVKKESLNVTENVSQLQERHGGYRGRRHHSWRRHHGWRWHHGWSGHHRRPYRHHGRRR